MCLPNFALNNREQDGGRLQQFSCFTDLNLAEKRKKVSKAPSHRFTVFELIFSAQITRKILFQSLM